MTNPLASIPPRGPGPLQAGVSPGAVDAPAPGGPGLAPRRPGGVFVRLGNWFNRKFQAVASCGFRRTAQAGAAAGPRTAEDGFEQQFHAALQKGEGLRGQLFGRGACNLALHALALRLESDDSLRGSGRRQEFFDRIFDAVDLTRENEKVCRDWGKLLEHASTPSRSRLVGQMIGVMFRLGLPATIGPEARETDLTGVQLPLGQMLERGFLLRNVTLSGQQLDEAIRDFGGRQAFTDQELQRGAHLSIDALPERYHGQKAQLMEHCMRRLEATMTAKPELRAQLMGAFGNFLLERPEYARTSPQIQAFIDKHRLIEQTLQYRQQKVLAPGTARPGMLASMLDGIEKGLDSRDAAAAQRFARRHGAGIFQMLRCVRARAEKGPSGEPVGELAEQAARISKRCCELLQPPALAAKLAGLVAYDDSSFPLQAEDGRVLVVNDEYFDGCVGTTGSGSGWQLAYVLEEKRKTPDSPLTWEVRGVEDVPTDLKAAPLLLDLYKKCQRHGGLMEAFSLLLPASLVSPAREELDRAKGRGGEARWTGAATEVELVGHITPLLAYKEIPPAPQETSAQRRAREGQARMTARLTPAIREGLVEKHRPLLVGPEGRIDPRKYEYWCRCWAVTLMHMSSVHHFGTEGASPYAVRGLAIALMNEAGSVARARGRGTHEEEPDQGDVLRRLAGVGDAFTCSSVLAEIVQPSLRSAANQDPALQSIYNALIPAVW